MGGPKAFAKDGIEKLLKQSSAAHWEVVDDSPEATMFVVKGFTAIHMKLDHILIVATDGYLERGAAAKAEADLSHHGEAKVDVSHQNVIPADEALNRLMIGNSRYVSGTMRRHDFATQRAALARG